MPPRHQTLPPAQTSSAREALQSFYCQLCQKGYSRMNDYEAHLSSYDHSHKQRLKDMKAMVRDPNATARARRQEQKADGVISIKLGEATSTSAAGSTGGFKKGGFKKTGFKSAFVPVGGAAAPAASASKDEDISKKGEEGPKSHQALKSELVESDTEDEGYEVYDPRKPTD
ncbi:G patch domain-containing protein 8 [Madurella mycetomatis]|uniref:G patch domain-containing protein 8 n=1 Tax=Madurella mycetomatis TaxID=100816 RepID=A0A175WFH1_9PEZI|nr:G patch domain-containing protein 8 [Madurella mycetomatis]